VRTFGQSARPDPGQRKVTHSFGCEQYEENKRMNTKESTKQKPGLDDASSAVRTFGQSARPDPGQRKVTHSFGCEQRMSIVHTKKANT
jgi:hypothetical protein